MAAISIMLSLNYHKKVILMENGQESDSLERVFRGIRRFYYVKEDQNYYVHRHGMDQILDQMYTTTQREPLLSKSAVEVIQDYLYYVPQSKVLNHLAYEYQLYQDFTTIVGLYEKLSDLVMIRTKSGNNLTTKQVLDTADLILVELNQDMNVLDEFFDNYSSIRQKAIFVFSQYKKSSTSIYKIMEKYHLRKEQVIVLSEHQPMSAAYIAGNLVHYLKGYNNCRKECEHYRNVRELRRAASIIVHNERSGLCGQTS